MQVTCRQIDFFRVASFDCVLVSSHVAPSASTHPPHTAEKIRQESARENPSDKDSGCKGEQWEAPVVQEIRENILEASLSIKAGS